MGSSSSLAAIKTELSRRMHDVSAAMGGTNVIFYYGAIGEEYIPLGEDVREQFQQSIDRMDGGKGLALILHTCGGETNATKGIVGHLQASFQHISAIVPSEAKSAGAIIALACNEIILSKSGMLGPTDPQIPVASGLISLKSIIARYEEAQKAAKANPNAAPQWEAVLSSIGEQNYQWVKAEYMANAAFQEGMLMERIKDAAAVQKIMQVFYHTLLPHDHPIRLNDMKELALKTASLEENRRLNDPAMRCLKIVEQLSATAQRPYFMSLVKR